MPVYSTEKWEIWYQDTFDRQTPFSMNAHGSGLAKGLAELWVRHLFESVTVDGQEGFSRFWLRWRDENIFILGDREGIKRLREWLYSHREYSKSSSALDTTPALLNIIVRAHIHLIEQAKTTEHILNLAAEADDPIDFEARLDTLINH
jgi:hypothetical protein